MFRHMCQAMSHHRRHFRDVWVLTEVKALEMCTIDATRALGVEADLGLLQVGKRADIVLVNARKAHRYPPVLTVMRLTLSAKAVDADSVIVVGQPRMRHRAHPHLDADEIPDAATREAGLAFTRAGIDPARRIEGPVCDETGNATPPPSARREADPCPRPECPLTACRNGLPGLCRIAAWFVRDTACHLFVTLRRKGG